MVNRNEVNNRKIDRAQKAGLRWRELSERRSQTVAKLKQGGPMVADAPERVERYRRREAEKRMAMLRAGLPEGAFSERRIGPTLDLDDDPPNEAARAAGVPVGRIVYLVAGGIAGEGFATGFMIASNLLITNHHVFSTPSDCEGCGVDFGYESIRGVVRKGKVFPLDGAAFFLSDEELDFAIVGVVPGAGLERYGRLNLDPMTGKILVGQPISIIQHPEGGPKKYGVRDNELLIAPEAADLFLQYTTDTLPGSSGSPVFNKDWEVVGVHHSGVPEVRDGSIMTITGQPWRRGMADDAIHWVANEGARVSCIYRALQSVQVPAASKPAFDRLMTSFGPDFSSLPALQSQSEGAQMESQRIESDRGVSIVVSGTGHFYFGGAGPAEPGSDRSAQAPSPPSVKEKKIIFDTDYDSRPGYDPDFLGMKVPLPGVTSKREPELLKEGDSVQVLKYHHYSLVMNKERRTVMWAAANADYTKKYRRKSRQEFGADTWVPDPRIPGRFQIMDQELYAPAAKFDRGHVIRRDDTAWGKTAREEVFANSDTFHWTNCTPQHEAFNRDMFAYAGIGLWGMLENHIAGQSKNIGNRVTIIAGPVLSDDDIRHDFGGGNVLIPTRFWKIVIAAEDRDAEAPSLAAYGFVLDQTYAIEDYGIERMERFDPGEFAAHQVSLQEISTITGVTFDKSLHAADGLTGMPEESRRIRLESLENVKIANRTGKEGA